MLCAESPNMSMCLRQVLQGFWVDVIVNLFVMFSSVRNAFIPINKMFISTSNLILAWISNHMPSKVCDDVMKLLLHSQTSTVQPGKNQLFML